MFKKKTYESLCLFLFFTCVHISIFKMNDLDHAVSASYTFFVHNPTDEMMTENLKFYSTQPQFSTKMYKNLEQQEFQVETVHCTVFGKTVYL